jgi:hypothetical protein
MCVSTLFQPFFPSWEGSSWPRNDRVESFSTGDKERCSSTKRSRPVNSSVRTLSLFLTCHKGSDETNTQKPLIWRRSCNASDTKTLIHPSEAFTAIQNSYLYKVHLCRVRPATEFHDVGAKYVTSDRNLISTNFFDYASKARGTNNRVKQQSEKTKEL